MRREFAIPGREWWGAFFEGRLIAYYYAYLIGGTMHISASKSHTDHLRMCPNDAMAFSFLQHCAQLPTCHSVIFGDYSPGVPSLTEFKEQFGFEKKSFPVFRSESPLFKLARALFQLRQRAAK